MRLHIRNTERIRLSLRSNSDKIMCSWLPVTKAAKGAFKI
jgi:hypothetical protein